MAKLLVKVTPAWVAPNIMTLAGFLLTLTCNIVVLYTNPSDPKEDFPTWVLVYVPLAMFSYQVLDAADGI